MSKRSNRTGARNGDAPHVHTSADDAEVGGAPATLTHVRRDLDVASSDNELLVTALSHLRAAIDLLDDAAAPGHIAAHADLAAHQLEALIGRGAPSKVEMPGPSSDAPVDGATRQ